MQLFDQMKQAGLDLPESFCAMILLFHLSDDMFNLTSTITQTIAISSTITQTVAVPSFNMETVAGRILAEMMLYGMALHLKISGEVRLVLIRTNRHTNLIKTNLANKGLVFNRIRMVRKVRVLSK